MIRFISIIFLQTLLVSIAGQKGKIVQLRSPELDSILRNDTVTLIDVRTGGEYANGHLDGAGQLNYYALDFRQKLLLLPRDIPLYFYCNTGYRSQKAAEFLVENGYDQVYNLESGIMEWNLHDLPVVVEPDARPDVLDKMEPDEFQALVRTDKPVFIDFYAPWCGPCRQMMPMIEDMQQAYRDDVTIVKINADASKKLVKELAIAGVPHFKLFHGGREIFTHTGLITDDQILDQIRKFL